MFKKVTSLLLMLVMVAAMAVSVSAADKITITITPPTGTTESGETYQAYKIFDLVKSSGTNATNDNQEHKGFAYSMPRNSIWLSAVQGVKNSNNVAYFKLTPSADGSTYAVTLNDGITLSEDTAKEIAAKLLAAKPASATPISINSGTETQADPGYYLITSSFGSNLILASTDITINEKNNFPSVDKAVAEGSEVAQIGQDVEFILTVTVPESATKAITLTDVMSTGLSFKSVTSVKNANNQDVVHTVSANVSTPQTFTITFADSVVQANKGGTITVHYLATMTDKAIVSALNDSDTANGGDKDDNTNEVTLQYSGFSQKDKVDVNTLSFQLNKYDGAEVVADGAEPTPIAGAVFQFMDANKNVMKLYKVSDTEFRIPTAAEITANTNIVEQFTTVAGTKITFKGVDSDLDYYLREIQAPAGFNKLSEDTKIEPADDLSLVSQIANNKGSELPSTGGIGTTLFYIIGSLLAVSAAVILVVKRRAEA